MRGLSKQERERINSDCKLFMEWFDSVPFEEYLEFLLSDEENGEFPPEENDDDC